MRQMDLRAFIFILAGIFFYMGASHAGGGGVIPGSRTPSTGEQLPQSHEGCAGGWYGGPRPGKNRFTKDPWLWMVSAEFAKRFCMPVGFISTELKGAEAVAFRVLHKTDEETCQVEDRVVKCLDEVVLRFDVYIKSDVKLPRLHDRQYFHAATLPSRLLISKSLSEQHEWFRYAKKHPDFGLTPPFEPLQVGLDGVKDGKVVKPVASLEQRSSFAGVFQGLDYYAFEASTEFFRNPGLQKNEVGRIFMTFLKSGRTNLETTEGLRVNDYAHVIELPEHFTDGFLAANVGRDGSIHILSNNK